MDSEASAMYMVVMPLHNGDAFVEEVSPAQIEEQGFALDMEYLEPIHEIKFYICTDKAKADERARKHRLTWN